MRVVLFAISAAILIGLAYHAFGAINPKQPLTATDKPARASHRCILKTTTQRFFIAPDGTETYAGGFTMWMKCPENTK